MAGLVYSVTGLVYPEVLGGGTDRERLEEGDSQREPFVARVVQLLSESHRPALRLGVQEGGYEATWKREFKLPWRKAGVLKHQDNVVDSHQ